MSTLEHSALPSTSHEGNLTIMAHVAYALYLFSYFTVGLSWLVAIIISYVKRNDANGTWLRSHFDWQIKTFWYTIIMAVVGGVLFFAAMPAGIVGLMADNSATSFSLLSASGLVLLAGVAVWVFAALWHLYRIVRGWLDLVAKQPV
jgi:uncharacterized membrane protein